MLRNNKGFSLVELLAIVVISSIIIWPLTTTLVNNIEINNRLHARYSGTSIADNTMYSFDKLDFVDLQDLVNTANGNNDYYIELNSTTCSTLSSTADQALCTQLFATIWNNISLDETEFRVFIYDYNLRQNEINDLLGNGTLPQEVRNEIGLMTASNDPNPNLLRITVWIEYYQDPVYEIVLSGLLFDD